MIKSLTKHLQTIQKEKKGIFVPYIMAGDHDLGLAGLSETIKELATAGASAIEIGVPFSDPVADGPIISQAGQRSLKKGVTLSQLVKTLQSLPPTVPLILMSYFNPIFQYGIKQLVEDLSSTHVKGLIIPDLPFEHKHLIAPYLSSVDLALISLISLTTEKKRQEMILSEAEGFVYAVTINGITGQSKGHHQASNQHLTQLKQLTSLPVLAGFGVNTLEDVRHFQRLADGVIVGSKIVAALHDKKKNEILDFIRQATQLPLG